MLLNRLFFFLYLSESFPTESSHKTLFLTLPVFNRATPARRHPRLSTNSRSASDFYPPQTTTCSTISSSTWPGWPSTRTGTKWHPSPSPSYLAPTSSRVGLGLRPSRHRDTAMQQRVGWYWTIGRSLIEEGVRNESHQRNHSLIWNTKDRKR